LRLKTKPYYPDNTHMKTQRKRHLCRSGKKGQTLVEYALILAFVSVCAISVLIRLGAEIKTVFSTITSQLAVASSSH
jgi:Flp pilus assembly pilin Flp